MAPLAGWEPPAQDGQLPGGRRACDHGRDCRHCPLRPTVQRSDRRRRSPRRRPQEPVRWTTAASSTSVRSAPRCSIGPMLLDERNRATPNCAGSMAICIACCRKASFSTRMCPASTMTRARKSPLRFGRSPMRAAPTEPDECWKSSCWTGICSCKDCRCRGPDLNYKPRLLLSMLADRGFRFYCLPDAFPAFLHFWDHMPHSWRADQAGWFEDLAGASAFSSSTELDTPPPILESRSSWRVRGAPTPAGRAA